MPSFTNASGLYFPLSRQMLFHCWNSTTATDHAQPKTNSSISVQPPLVKCRLIYSVQLALQRARTRKKETKFVCNSWKMMGDTLMKNISTWCGVRQCSEADFPFTPTKNSKPLLSTTDLCGFLWLVTFTFPNPLKGGETFKCMFSEDILSFIKCLTKQQISPYSHFLFPDFTGTFFFIFTYSFMSCTPPKRVAFGLSRFVCLFWRPAFTWSLSCYLVMQTTSDVTTSVGAEQKQQVTGWWESTCSSTFNLQALPSSFAQCSQQEVATGTFSQAPWGTKHQKSQNQHYPNNSKLVESFSNSYPS